MKKIIRKTIVGILCLSLVVGCGLSSDEETTSSKVITEEVTEETTAETTEVTTEEVTTEAVDESIPDYTGEAFIELNGNVPDFTDDEKKSTEAFERYADLDKLGRCGVAYANICPELMPTEERGEIGDIRPSGWHTVKYSEVIEDLYLYNRSHLIAFSLAGENANPKNLITGTRYMNQETMQIFELKVLDYVRNTNNHVLYRVTPVFEGDNLLAKGVQMEAWSVEDEGKSISFNVFCYNVQPGIEIDYATGESRLAESATTNGETITETTTEAKTEARTEENTQADTSANNQPVGGDFATTSRDFVVNTNSRKIHLPSCSSVNDMKEKNKWEYTGTLNELIEKGYSPCGRCLAEYK